MKESLGSVQTYFLYFYNAELFCDRKICIFMLKKCCSLVNMINEIKILFSPKNSSSNNYNLHLYLYNNKNYN